MKINKRGVMKVVIGIVSQKLRGVKAKGMEVRIVMMERIITNLFNYVRKMV